MAIHSFLGNSKGRLLPRFSTKLIVYLAAVILLVSAASWWYHTKNSPEWIYWGMVQNNLKATGFSRTVDQEGDLQKLTQVVSVRTAPEHLVNSRSVITQGQPATTRVVTESVGTPYADYVRYADISTTEKGPSGKALDFSGVKNIWGKTESGDPKVTNGQLYSESVLGVIPMGNLTASKRKALIEQMKQSGAYKYSLASVERSGLLRRPRYTFDVQVTPVAYISTLKAFANDLGLNHLAAVDPSQYQSAQPVSVQLVIDGWSQQLVEVRYGGGARVEKYSGFDSIKPLQMPPQESVPISELQSRLQAVQ